MEQHILKQAAEQYKLAASRAVNPKTYTKDMWFYSKSEDRYITTSNEYVGLRLLKKHKFFETKLDAKKFRKCEKELFRLMSIKIQEDIDSSLNEMEIPNNVIDIWRKEYWWGRDFY